MEKKKYFLKFYYIGKEKYYGSQRQPDFLTIEDELIDILKKRNYIKDIETSEFQVASRTDRHVSARSSVFSMITNKDPILMEINSFLPEEIGIWAKSVVSLNANPRYDASLRWYKYIVKSPVHHLKLMKFNFKVVKKACKYLQGFHNFQNFSKRDKEMQKYERELEDVYPFIVNGYLIFDFKSQAFLRQQIRRIVAKLLELGKGEINMEEFKKLFDPTKFYSYQPAEPNGLILWDISYPDLNFITDKKSFERMQNYFKKMELNMGLKHQLFSVLKHDDSS